MVDKRQVSDQASVTEEGVSKKEFSIARKGYDPAEVDEHLAEIDVAFREFEEYAARLKQELAEAKAAIARLEAAEQDSVDKAMLAVFDAKERIMERARQKAKEIENEARIAAGMTPVADEPVAGYDDDLDELVGILDRATLQLEDSEPIDSMQPARPVGAPQPAEPAAANVGDGPDPAAVLSQMLAEADTIRSQLENGLTSAFDEIERMQRNAEQRAAALLDEARREAAELRSAGKEADQTHDDAKIEVMLPADGPDDGQSGERPSRYSRNSAKLPRIGEDSGESVLASMNQLRNKLREAEMVAQQVQEPSAS